MEKYLDHFELKHKAGCNIEQIPEIHLSAKKAAAAMWKTLNWRKMGAARVLLDIYEAPDRNMAASPSQNLCHQF